MSPTPGSAKHLELNVNINVQYQVSSHLNFSVMTLKHPLGAPFLTVGRVTLNVNTRYSSSPDFTEVWTLFKMF